ncbi:MAG: DUF3108 domain-containing protein [Burkholderiales bacterium]|nr:DUF3108 domain-containing protein [Burkholderiales bacterium]
MTAASTRSCVAAIVLSLLLHIVALSGAWLVIPQPTPPAPPLEARLVRAPPEAAPAPPAPEPQRKPRPATPRRAAPAVPATTASTPIALPPPAAPAPLPLPVEPVATLAPPTQPASAAPQPEAPPPRSLPKKGSITYTLLLGSNLFIVGKTIQSWEIEAGTYKLGSVSETTGLADLFASQHLNSLSTGKITASGLRPETFLMSRKRRGEIEAAKADFHWDREQITLGRVPVQRIDQLPAGSQDMLSFIYQLALAPPSPGRLRLPITNGASLEIYELEVLPEENLETALGTLKSLPIRQLRRPGEESIEIWLATEYRHLPVRIRFINREGEPSGEQRMSEIHVSEE